MPHLDSRRTGALAACSFTEIVPSSVVMKSAFGMALDLDHPVYDCLYLALAALPVIAASSPPTHGFSPASSSLPIATASCRSGTGRADRPRL